MAKPSHGSDAGSGRGLMPTTLASTSKITGCQIDVIEADGAFFVEASRGGIPVAISQDRTLKGALTEIVQAVYRKNSMEARVAADYRCSRCGRIGPLQSHHVVHRARGQRQDDTDGLLQLCPRCHEKAHGGA